MPRLEHLRKDLLSMSEDELRAKLHQIRDDRKLRKESPKARKAKVHKAEKSKTGLQKLLSGMSAAEMEALIKELDNAG